MMPIRWTLPVTLCAREARGQTIAEPAIPLMKSRRRIAFPTAGSCADFGCDYSRVLRPAKWGPTVILRGNNPHDRMSALGQKRTLEYVSAMSALLPKADIHRAGWDVRFVPEARSEERRV